MRVEAIKPFLDLKENTKRAPEERFTVTNERGEYLKALGLVKIVQERKRPTKTKAK